MSLKAVIQLLSSAAILLFSGSILAQSSDSREALLLVVPQDSQIKISATCSGDLIREDIERGFSNLASSLQGKLTRLESSATEERASGNLSSTRKVITFTATLSAPGLIQEGSFNLPAFIASFRRFQQIDILFFVPPINGFRGLRNFRDGVVNIQLLEEPVSGSNAVQPYRYRVQLNDQASPLDIPLTQQSYEVLISQTPPERYQNPSQKTFLLRLVFLAASAGLIVMLIGMAFIRRRVDSSIR
jgi:hypothetical protein